ncbi:PEP-CTERM sorting domain-containing protein [Kiritimatiellaeota bacterium B1221]|nr:PEP-CTERM sorting domain-containing protein [Kiritimatiellaeota bacterium B1221]
MNSFHKTLFISGIGLSAALHLSAATILHYQFEDSPGFLNDSSGNNHSLSNSGSMSQVASPFTNPVPQTGDSNLEAAQNSGSAYLSTSDSASFTSNTFTLEAFFHANNYGGSSTLVIAGQFGSGGAYVDERSFAISTTSNKFRLLLSSTGSETAIYDDFTLTNGHYYYAAASVDILDSGDSAITFYLKDLTADTALQVVNKSKADKFTGNDTLSGPLFNSDAPFSIAATGQGGANFVGTVDEVRLSNTRLSESELLVIPEPSSLLLLSAAFGALLMFKRHRK